MLLIRGFNQEQYAREINKGIIGFRDLLTTLLYPESNGYRLSNYYEKSLIEAAAQISPFELDYADATPEITNMLGLIFNPFVQHFYLSYFHILNQHSEEWLDKNFGDNAHFIFAIPKLQKLNGMDAMMFGKNMIGSSMIYLSENGTARTSRMMCQKAGMVYLMQNELDACQRRGGATEYVAMTLSNMIASVCCEAFARRCDEQFDESENEFRIIYKTPTPFSYETNFFEADEHRPFFTLVDGIPYEGVMNNRLIKTPLGVCRSHNMILETKSPMVTNPLTTISQVLEDKKSFQILPYFLPVHINDSFQHYGYIGSKKECKRFIAAKLKDGLM